MRRTYYRQYESVINSPRFGVNFAAVSHRVSWRVDARVGGVGGDVLRIGRIVESSIGSPCHSCSCVYPPMHSSAPSTPSWFISTPFPCTPPYFTPITCILSASKSGRPGVREEILRCGDRGNSYLMDGRRNTKRRQWSKSIKSHFLLIRPSP